MTTDSRHWYSDGMTIEDIDPEAQAAYNARILAHLLYVIEVVEEHRTRNADLMLSRKNAVLEMMGLGYSLAQIGEMVGRSKQTIHRWLLADPR